jgi:pimeloyl-ACP methyl ester carboxylesterase
MNSVGWRPWAAPFLLILLVAWVAITPEATTVVAQSAGHRAASGDLLAGRVDIGGGRKLYLECRGRGSPTVILEAGLRNRADIWSVQDEGGTKRQTVLPGVASFTRVCAYDRPGTTLGTDKFSRSDPVPMPRTARDAVADLHALLRAAKIPGPYVMVGHSTGGLIARLYASTYSDQIVGLVLVDAISERMRTALTPAQWTLYNRRFLIQAPPEIASYPDLETIDFEASFDQMRRAAAARPLRPMPLVVLSKDHPFGLPSDLPKEFVDAVEQAWKDGQDGLATLLPNARHVVDTHSGHYIQVERPQWVIQAIRQVVEAVRKPAAWGPRRRGPGR